ncbi:MAG TPA: hypothetical protein VEN31_00045 [Candidatus Bathyarchaeia archaeon]|nr:hypothetical protein [Candidatus Bathyarchaeia archaeon]
MQPGLYLTFFSEGEAFDRELPPVGPLEHVVVRDRMLVADRKDGENDPFGVGGRWVEAERELRRATGQEPGGATRPDLRVGAPEGVYLRFVSFGEAAEHDAMPELGPYAVVVIGPRGVEADGDALATRTGSSQRQWELTGVGGSAFVGVIRPDIALRTRSTAYHPEIKPFRPGGPPVASASQPAAQVSPDRTAATPQSARPPEDPALTLRDRIGSERPTYAAAALDADAREWGGAAWQLRYFIIGALIVLIAAFSVPSIRSLVTGGSPTSATVGIGTSLNAPSWTYNVGSVRRVATIGTSKARGTYLVIQVAATNRGSAGAQLQPSNFSLAAGSGEEYAAQPATSSVYSSALNPDSSYIWPTDFPVGRPVVVPLIFEVNSSVTGTQLVILDVPATRVRLE